jgi:hypothetical protein
MIGWLQPAAFWGLMLLALPLGIHLLRRDHAYTVPFPSIRFVPGSRTAAVRLRPPSDVLLLAIRTGIVSAAVVAAAQPLLLTASRRAAWDGRIARAIVIDTSASMQPGLPKARLAADAEAARESQPPDLAFRVEDEDLAEALRRALAWLDRAPPARREVIVISDFQRGTFTRAMADDVPSHVGLRFIPIDPGVRDGAFQTLRMLSTPGAVGRELHVRLTADSTLVSLVPAVAGGLLRALRIEGADTAERDRLIATLAAAGTPAPREERPVVLRFGARTSGEPAAGLARALERWMLDAVLHLELDPELSGLARQGVGGIPDAEPWTVLLRDRSGRPVVRAAAQDRSLVVDVASPAESYFAAAVARATLIAAAGSAVGLEDEVARVRPEELSSWTRAPGPVPGDAWRRSDESDARWFWCVGVLLLLGEQWLRARPGRAEEGARAAA